MFWRKWHISLTSWLTDYLFTPLIIAFRNYGKIGLTLAILINFTIIGIWHGANWTFIMFGFLHGCFYIPLIINGTLNKKNKVPKKMLITYFIEAWKMTSTFLLVTLTFIIFRSANVGQAIYYFEKLFSASLFDFPFLRFKLNAIVSITFVLVMLLTEGLQRGRLHGLDIGFINKPVLRWAIYYSLICIIIYFGATSSNQFIYFKF
jgi:D-alanyl-lipoteichoic acid acyltransferase DltB (MBOAT superfamily)